MGAEEIWKKIKETEASERKVAEIAENFWSADKIAPYRAIYGDEAAGKVKDLEGDASNFKKRLDYADLLLRLEAAAPSLEALLSQTEAKYGRKDFDILLTNLPPLPDYEMAIKIESPGERMGVATVKEFDQWLKGMYTLSEGVGIGKVDGYKIVPLDGRDKSQQLFAQASLELFFEAWQRADSDLPPSVVAVDFLKFFKRLGRDPGSTIQRDASREGTAVALKEAVAKEVYALNEKLTPLRGRLEPDGATYQVLSIPKYDPASYWGVLYSPYLQAGLLYKKKVDEHRRLMKKKLVPGPGFTTRVKASLYSAKDTEAALLLCEIVKGLTERGDAKPDEKGRIVYKVKWTTLLDAVPEVAQRLAEKESRYKTQELKRIWTDCLKYLDIHTDLRDYYSGLVVPEKPPTWSKIKNSSLIISHTGHIKKLPSYVN